MRFIAFAALAGLSLGLMDARPASAAWQCVGPEVACGGSSAVKKKSSYKKAAAPRAHKRTAAARTAKKRSVAASRTTYSGGGSHGVASYYWQPQRVASGGWFNPNAMTAAHRSLPFGTRVRVTNKRNGRAVVVTINDRGPFIKGRIIDLSKAAAGAIGMQGAGLAPVAVEVIGRG